MNAFTRSISQVSKGVAGSFRAYPAAMASALAFAVVAMFRIQIDWPEQQAYDFLFNCLHFSLALGAIFGLTAVTAAKSRRDDARSFAAANLTGAAVVIVAFLLLYFFGGTAPADDAAYRAGLTGIAQARAMAAMLISLLGFIVLAGYPKDRSDFARSFFMTHKAFFIALIYGVVMYAGGAGVAGAVEALLYRDMSGKVYMYIGTVAGFLAYAVFIGYFPDFGKNSADPKREVAQRQPRFIEILLEFIISPLALALTAVLLIWSGKTAFTGEQVSFMRLSSIAATFATVGLWLHIMVTHAQSGLARFYRRVFPFAAIVILIFEAGVLFVQVEKWGIQTAEYSFTLIWLLTMAAAVLLIVMKDRAHVLIAALICGLAAFSVLPALGYHALPIKTQIIRLEKLLSAHGMLKADTLVPAASEPERSVREAITDTVSYLARAQNAKLPPWFPARLNEGATFEQAFGFAQAWPGIDPDQSGGYRGTYLYLPSGAVDISGYRWAVNMHEGKDTAPVAIAGQKGLYEIYWTAASGQSIPAIRVELDGRVIHEQDMRAYLEAIREKFPPGQVQTGEASVQDMSYVIEIPEVRLLLVFESVSISIDLKTGLTDYWFNPRMLYMGE